MLQVKELNPELKETIELPNGLTLEAWDFSKNVAGDRYQVALGCRIEINLENDAVPPSDGDRRALSKLQSELGPVIYYEYQIERNFIPREKKEAIWQELWKTFLSNSLTYLSKMDFARKFIPATLAQFKKDPFTFRLKRKKSYFRTPM